MCREKPGAMTLVLPYRSGNVTGSSRSFAGSRGSRGGASLIRTSDRSTTAVCPSACTSTRIVVPPSLSRGSPSSTPLTTSVRTGVAATPNCFGRTAQRSARNLARAPGTRGPGFIGSRWLGAGVRAPFLSNSAKRSSRRPLPPLVFNGRISATESPRSARNSARVPGSGGPGVNGSGGPTGGTIDPWRSSSATRASSVGGFFDRGRISATGAPR